MQIITKFEFFSRERDKAKTKTGEELSAFEDEKERTDIRKLNFV